MIKTVKCLKCSVPMEEVLTRKGVLIDVCPSCKGGWLDQGELNFFSKDRKTLNNYEINGLEKTHKINDKCPKCASEMQSGCIPVCSYQVKECLSCKGLFLDAHEFNKLQGAKNFQTLRRDASVVLSKDSRQDIPLSIPVKLPSLNFTMGAVCLSLYGILFAVAVFFMEIMQISITEGSLFIFLFVCIQFYFAPIILDWQLRLFGSMNWQSLEELPRYFKKSILKLCKKNRIPIPKVGIIHDSSPEAFTYGRTPYSARLVFSRGMFELLDEEEVEAVLAHELGHIKHWDFVVMTAVGLLPLLLHIVYRNIKEQFSQKYNKKRAGFLGMALVVSYLAYLVSEYLVLFVSRIREYYADRFSCFATKKPNKLLTALVKVSYGLLSARPLPDSKKGSYEDKRKTMESFNIMNISRSKEIALANQGEGDSLKPESIKDVMRWDLWNPWAFYYELHSTHPLTAKRINAISSYAISMKQTPYLVFKKEKPESYWDDFFVDIFILYLPYILGLSGFLFWFLSTSYKYNLILTFIFCVSLGALIRTLKVYPSGRFRRYSVASLLKIIKVSPVRSYPVALRGYILGRAEAGNIFSEDFVLKDPTGIIFLNHEPFGFNILFALFRYKKFQGKDVLVTGWYRRSPTSYIEVRNIRSPDTKSWAYTYYYKIGLCLIGLLTPFIWLYLL